MYHSFHLDSFLRMLVTHLGTVIEEGERLLSMRSDKAKMAALWAAIDDGVDAQRYQKKLGMQTGYESLFVLQMSQAREWADRLGQLDPAAERYSDEFLAATFAIEKMLCERQTRKTDYSLENSIIGAGQENILQGDLSSHVNIEAMTLAVYELLGRMEELYVIVEEEAEQQVVNCMSFSSHSENSVSAKIIPLFAKSRGPGNDNSS